MSVAEPRSARGRQIATHRQGRRRRCRRRATSCGEGSTSASVSRRIQAGQGAGRRTRGCRALRPWRRWPAPDPRRRAQRACGYRCKGHCWRPRRRRGLRGAEFCHQRRAQKEGEGRARDAQMQALMMDGSVLMPDRTMATTKGEALALADALLAVASAVELEGTSHPTTCKVRERRKSWVSRRRSWVSQGRKLDAPRCHQSD